MLPIERQNRIRELLQKNNSIKIADLSKQLSVSEMTIHRDIKPLIDEGLIIKTFGGVTLSQEKAHPNHLRDQCIYCNRTINEKLAYRLIMPNHKIENTCCAHCGLLRHRQLADDVVQAICHDFFRSTTISASLAWYIIDTSIDIGCCQPQVLTFEWKEHAEKFVKGFGGNIYSFEEVIEVIFKKMHHPEYQCHH